VNKDSQCVCSVSEIDDFVKYNRVYSQYLYGSIVPCSLTSENSVGLYTRIGLPSVLTSACNCFLKVKAQTYGQAGELCAWTENWFLDSVDVTALMYTVFRKKHPLMFSIITPAMIFGRFLYILYQLPMETGMNTLQYTYLISWWRHKYVTSHTLQKFTL